MASAPEARVVLVTGAGRGIGRDVAVRFSAHGWRVALTARSGDQLAQTAAACDNPTLALPADITDPAAIEQIYAAIEEQWGPVDVLVANAGAGVSATIVRTSDTDWQRMLDLNLTAPFRCLRRAVPSMVERGYGRIVVIASVAAKRGEPYISAYTASKHGVLGLVRSAAAELAKTGVTVNAVCPGYVDTPMTEQTVAGIATRTGRTEDEARRTLAAVQPTGRLVEPGEVADAVWFCVANASVNGQGINVDGSGAVVSVERVDPPELARPRGFSHAVVGTGTTVFLAGQTALDRSGRIVDGDVVAQFERALGNLLTALRAAGGRPDQLQRA